MNEVPPIPTAAPATILAVDATESLARLGQTLTAAGYRVRLAGSGELALAAVAASVPDLILLDIKMPDIDGLEVCRRLKARAETRDIPVILLSAFAGVEEWVAGLQLGAADHLGKPFQTAELLTRVGTHIALRRARTAAAEVSALRRLNEQLEAEVVRRQQAEADLRESDSNLRALVEGTTQTVILIDLAGTVLAANEVAARRLGRKPEEILGTCIYNHLPPEIVAARRARLAEVIATGQPLRFEDVRAGRTIDQSLAPICDPFGKVTRVAIFADDITERRQAEAALQESETRFRAIARNTPDHLFIQDRDLRYTLVVNPQLGLTEADMLGRTDRDFLSGEGAEQLTAVKQQVLATGQSRPFATSLKNLRGDDEFFEGAYLPKYDPAGRVDGLVGYFRNVTAQKHTELEREATVELLRLVNESRSTRELMRAVVAFFRRQSGCEAVGVRLHDGADYPYYEAQGFPEKFVQLENRLCTRDAAGAIVRDRTGNPVLECMCGNVICGRFDPAQPFFTASGSFWTNGTTALLASTTAADRQARTRNRCNGEGYESVALLPLRFGAERLGLLQLNDRRPGRFTAEGIALWERLSGYLAIALAKLRAEEALRLSEQRLALHVQQTPLAVVEFSLDGRVTEWNPAAIAIFGFTREEAIGQFWHFMVPEPVWSQLDGVWEALVTQHGGSRSSNLNRTKDGRIIHCEWFNTPLIGPDGRSIGVASLVMDITERQRAEETLRVSEVLLKHTQRLSKVGGWEWDVGKQTMSWTEETYRIHDLNPDEFAPGSADHIEKSAACYGPEDRQAILAAFRHCAERGEPYDFEVPFTSATGRRLWIRTTGEAVRDGPKIVKVVGNILDITERKQTEAALRESESHLRTAERVAHLGYYSIDLGTGQTEWSDETFRIFGLEPARGQEPTAETYQRFVHPDDVAKLYEHFGRSIRDRVTFDLIYRIRRVDGELRHVHSVGLVTSNARGEATSMFGTLHDVTEQQRTEEQVRLALAEKEILLKEVHHRVKNNLQIVSGLLELQAERLPDPALRAAFRDSQSRIRSIALVHEKLYQSAGLARLDFKAYVQSLVAHLFHAHLDPAQAVRFDLRMADVTLSLTSAVPCGLLINELVTNALKHAFPADRPAPDHAIVLTWEDAGAHWRLTVADNGPGLSSGLEWSQSQTLGLRLVQMLTQQLKGAVRLEPGPGCRFVVEFPKP